MKKSLRNYRLFFHRMGLLFLFIPLIVLILSIVLPDRGFSEKENRVLSSLPHLNGSQIASGGFEKQFETYENNFFPVDLVELAWHLTLTDTKRMLQCHTEKNEMH